MNVPLLDLTLQNAPLKAEMLKAIEGVIDTNRYIMGPEITGLEQEVAAYCQSPMGIGVSSGTDALLVSMMALDVKAGDEVITTPYTFFATAGCISRLGAKPVFVDVDPVTYNINPTLIEAAITPRTVGIIPVHLYGQCADMDPILSLAKARGLWVLEDAAQAIGSAYKGRRAGSMGIGGCFSFFPSKNLGCLGDGGMVTANDEVFGKKVALLRTHGAEPKYYHALVGGNFRLDALQASVLRIKLRHLDGWTTQRQENAADYLARFAEKKIPAELLSLPTLPPEGQGHRHIFNQFILQTHRRDGLLAHLKNAGIGTEIYYPVPLHVQECFANLGYKAGSMPVSEAAAKETLAIPIYSGLTAEQRAYVVDTVAAFFG